MAKRTIYFNGKVYTVDKNRSICEAVVTENNKILFTGTTEDALKYKEGGTSTVDLNGMLMLPGFIDSHAHPISAAFFDSGCSLTVADSVEDCIRKLKEYVEAHPEEDRYFGRGYDEIILNDISSTRKLLDEVCEDKPILLMGAMLHCGWCNTAALKAAGVDENTLDPEPGAHYYVREENGYPNGTLIESGPVLDVMNKIRPFNLERVREEAIKLTRSYAEDGVTSIQDGGAWGYTAEEGYRLLEELCKEDSYHQRVQTGFFFLEHRDMGRAIPTILAYREKHGCDKDRLRYDYLKILNDGNYATRSASLLDPYTDGTNADPLLYGDDLKGLCLRAAEKGIDIGIHNCGDRTAREVVQAAKALREHGYTDTRVTSMHTQCVNENDLGMFSAYGVIANSSPVWFGKAAFKEDLLGARAKKLFRMNTLWRSGAVVTFSSDYPADSFGKAPLLGIEMGITRKLYGHPEDETNEPADECLTLEQMIEAYTINGAYQMRMEDRLGSIEPGKYADMIVLDRDLFKIDVYDIHNVNVEMTIFNGEIVFKRQTTNID